MLGYGLTSVIGAIAAEIFEGRHYGSIFGTLMPGLDRGRRGRARGSPACCTTRTGSYAIAFWIAIGCSVRLGGGDLARRAPRRARGRGPRGPRAPGRVAPWTRFPPTSRPSSTTTPPARSGSSSPTTPSAAPSASASPSTARPTSTSVSRPRSTSRSRWPRPILVERGLDPAPDGLGPALVMRLLLDLPRRSPPTSARSPTSRAWPTRSGRTDRAAPDGRRDGRRDLAPHAFDRPEQARRAPGAPRRVRGAPGDEAPGRRRRRLPGSPRPARHLPGAARRPRPRASRRDLEPARAPSPRRAPRRRA